MANKKGTTIVNAAPEVVAEIVAADTADLDQAIRLERAVENAQIEIIETVLQVGRMQNMDALSHLSAGAVIKMYDQVVGARKHVGLPYRKPDGSVARVESAEEFCRVFLGRNYESLREARQNLRLVGPQLYDQLEAQGLLQRDDWRALRNAEKSDDARLQEALAAPDEAKLDRLLVVVDQLKAQQEQSAGEIKALKERDAAREEILSKRAKRIDELEAGIERRKMLTAQDLENEAVRDIDYASDQVCGATALLAAAYARRYETERSERMTMVRRQALERVVVALIDVAREWEIPLDFGLIIESQFGPPLPGEPKKELKVVR